MTQLLFHNRILQNMNTYGGIFGCIFLPSLVRYHDYVALSDLYDLSLIPLLESIEFLHS